MVCLHGKVTMTIASQIMATKWSELDCNKGDQLENLSTSF